MHIRPRPTLVIALSSLIIAAVLALTVFGFYAYLGWKKKHMERVYRLALYGRNATLFDRYIKVNLTAQIEKSGAFRGGPVLSGTIKNLSNKKIYSLKLKVLFYDPDRRVVYHDTFYPIGLDFESLVNISDIAKETKNFLLEADSISFKHKLKNCPAEVMAYLGSKLKFAKAAPLRPLLVEYKIEGLDIR